MQFKKINYDFIDLNVIMGKREMKTKDSGGCCSINFLKYMLFIFLFFFLLAGLTVLGVGIWSLVVNEHYMNLLSSGAFAVTAYLLVVAGGMVVVLTVIGCIGMFRENKECIMFYAIFLLLIFLMELAAGVVAYIYNDKLHDELTTSLSETFTTNYQFDDGITSSIDSLQKEWKCCGAGEYADWQQSRWIIENPDIPNKVPDSCCITILETCGRMDHPSNIWWNGCILALEDEVEKNLVILGAIGLGFCALQLFGILFSCCLYFQLKEWQLYGYS